MLTTDQLKSMLLQPEMADGMVADADKRQGLLDAMLQHIGDVDPVLRDSGIYLTLVRWITAGLLPREEVRLLLPIITDDAHLFYRIGEREGDGVFTRAFSMLAIPLLLHLHQEEPLFAQAELYLLKAALLRYAYEEQDLRGYLVEKGWAHAAAHSADTLGWLALCEEFTRIELLEILDAIAHLAIPLAHVYTDDEDERFSAAVVDLLRRNQLTVADWMAWMQSLVAMGQSADDTPHSRARTTNTKHFLHSLYFHLRQLKDDDISLCDMPELSHIVENAISTMTHF